MISLNKIPEFTKRCLLKYIIHNTLIKSVQSAEMLSEDIFMPMSVSNSQFQAVT